MVVEQDSLETDTEDAFFVHQGSWKLLARALASLVFVVLCLGLVLPGGWFAEFSDSRFITSVVKIVAVVGVLFFGFTFLWLLSRVPQRNKPVIVVSSEGLLDRSSALSPGMLHWNEIESIDKTTFLGQPMLSITLTDADAYLDRQNPLKRVIMSVNVLLIGAPIAIAQSNIPVTLTELLSRIHQYRN